MHTAPRPSSNLLYRRLAVLCVLGAIVLFGLKYFSKFPYSGSWISEQKQAPTEAYLTNKVSFHPNGSCSWEMRFTAPSGAIDNAAYDCSYKMRGGAAGVTLTSRDAQWIAGNWHLATTAKQKALAPLFDLKIFYWVMPLEDGKKLLAAARWSEIVEQKTGESRYYPYSDEQTFKRAAQ